MNSTVPKYTKTAIVLHWLVGLTIIGMLVLGWYMTDLPKGQPDRAFFFNLHKSIGVMLIVLVAWRICWRLTHQPPAYLASLRDWEKRLASVTHFILYLLTVAMLTTGFFNSLYGKYGVKWFGIKLFPGLDNNAIRENFVQMHCVIGWAIAAVIVIHVLGALKHKLIDKDKTLSRMSLH